MEYIPKSSRISTSFALRSITKSKDELKDEEGQVQPLEAKVDPVSLEYYLSVANKSR